MRDEQSAEFNAILAEDGFQSAILFDITLRDGRQLYLSDVPITLDGHTYTPDIRDPGDWSFQQGIEVDRGDAVTLQNADGTYGYTDETGASLLQQATVIVRWAVAHPGANDWQVDTVTEGNIYPEQIDQAVAKLLIVPDYADQTRMVSGITITLEELHPEDSTVTNSTSGIARGSGWSDRNFNWRADDRLAHLDRAD